MNENKEQGENCTFQLYVINTFSACVSKYSGGSVYHFPLFHAAKNPALTEKYEADLRRYLTRKIGFEAVMRIRCTKGKHQLEYFSEEIYFTTRTSTVSLKAFWNC